MRTFWRHPRLVAVLAAATLACYAAAMWGLIPSRQTVARLASRVISAERYPCESCGCGCTGARECWTTCCCHSDEEKLAWAIRNGVQPPEYARFTDDQWVAAANAVEPGSASCGMCVPQIQQDLRSGAAKAASDCGRPAAPCAPAASCDSAGCDEKTPRRDGHQYLSALGCQGLAQMLLVPPPPVLTAPAMLVRTEVQTAMHEANRAGAPAPAWRHLDIPTPPPRA